MTRRRRTVLVGCAVLVAVLVLAGVAVTAKLDSILNHYKDEYLPQVAARLGRPVEVGRISTTLFSGLGVTVDDVAVGADPSTPTDKLPLASVGRVRVRVSALRALFSLGRTIRVTEIRIERPTINLVRLPDGRLNVEALADHLAATATAPTEPAAPMSARTRDMIDHARIDEARLEDGRVRFVDLKDLQPTVDISALNLTLADVGLDSPWTADLSAAVLAASKNLELHTRFGVAGDLDHVPPPLEAVRIKLDRTDLAPLAPFLARAVQGLQAATVSADLDADLGALAPNGHGPTKLVGGASLGGVRFAGGAPFDASLDADVGMQGADLDVRKLRLALAKMAIVGHGQLHALTTQPRFDNFAIESEGVDFDEIRRLYPLLDQQAGATLHGPATLRVVASGGAAAQTFDVDVDLTPASIAAARVFAKPAGTPLRLRAGGTVHGDALDLQTLSLQLADLALRGGGTVRHFAAPVVDLHADAQLSNLAGLVRLLPGVAAELPAHATVAGALGIHAKASGGADALTAHAEVTLAGANLKLAAAHLLGGGHVIADVTRKGKDATLRVDADLGDLEAFYEDLVHKPRAMPLSFRLDARQAGTRLSPTLDLRLAATRVHAEGSVDSPSSDVDLRATIDKLDMGTLTALLPSLGKGMPPITVSAAAHVQGRSDKPETMRAEVSGLKLTSRKSDLSGDMTVRNLARPEIELHARSSYLDTDDLLPKGESSSKPAAAGAPKPAAPSPLANVRGHASVHVARGVASKVPFEQLQAELDLRDGHVHATKLEVGAWGGHFSGSGSEFDLVDERGPFHVVGKVTQLDVEQALARFGDSHGLLRGKLSATIDTRGRGTSPVDLQKTLEGSLGGSIEQAQLVAVSLGGAIASTLATKLPLGKVGKLASGTDLRTLAGQVQFAAGAMHLSKPLKADTPDGPLALTGRIFLDGRIDLTGTFQLTPAAASALVGNRVHLKEPVPLSLELGGELRHPTVQLANLSDVVKLFAVALGAAGVQGKANDLLKKTGLQNKVPGLDASKIPTSEADARAKAAAAAQAAQAAAAQRAREAAAAAQRAAQERARQEAEAAKRKMEDQAKNKLKGLFGH